MYWSIIIQMYFATALYTIKLFNSVVSNLEVRPLQRAKINLSHKMIVGIGKKEIA